jgi:hypothetical protein
VSQRQLGPVEKRAFVIPGKRSAALEEHGGTWRVCRAGVEPHGQGGDAGCAGPADAVLPDWLELAVAVDEVLDRVMGVEQCLRQDQVGCRKIGDAWVLFASQMDLSRIGGRREGLENAVTAGSTTVQSPAWTSQAWRRWAMVVSVNRPRQSSRATAEDTFRSFGREGQLDRTSCPSLS